MYRTGTDMAAAAGAVRARLAEYARRLPQLHARQVMLVAFPAFSIDAMADFRARLHAAFAALSGHGASIDTIEAGRVVMLDLIAAGHWEQAEQVGMACLEMARQPQGSRLRYHQFLADLGLLAAGRGDLPTARRYAAELNAWSAPRGLQRLCDAADRIAVRVGLAEADYEAAYRAAVRIGDTVHYPRHHLHETVDDVFDLVEAAVNSGRVVQAREHAARAEGRGLAEVSPRSQALAIAMSAMTARRGDISDRYTGALNHPGLAESPFESARIALAQGRWLRRQRRHREAQAALERAAAGFYRLGAHPWADQAHAEHIDAVADAGHTRGAASVLSARERRVAELAAAGHSNREIAADLFLSPRTVDTHLYHVFRKLDISKRSELAAALHRSSPGALGRDAGMGQH
jgi:DNA-binding CsgD family transcriptional regulator